MRESIRQWVRSLIGFDEIDKKLDDIAYDISVIRAEQSSLIRDELHPARKAASDALARRTLSTLVAEDKARKHTTGES